MQINPSRRYIDRQPYFGAKFTKLVWGNDAIFRGNDKSDNDRKIYIRTHPPPNVTNVKIS